MRFRYIDSKGNEVALDSVEALAARIELGAVSSSTEMYDAGTNTWGPADSHEVYRQLLAEAAARDFGVPPTAAGAPNLAETHSPDEPGSDRNAAAGDAGSGEDSDDDVLDLELSIDPSINPLAPAALADEPELAESVDATPAEDQDVPSDAGSVVTAEDFTSPSPGAVEADSKQADEDTSDVALDPDPPEWEATPAGPGEEDEHGAFADNHIGEHVIDLSGGIELEEPAGELEANDAALDREEPLDGFTARPDDSWQSPAPVESDVESFAATAAAGGAELDNPWGTSPREPEGHHPFDDPGDPFATGFSEDEGAWPDPALVEEEEQTPGKKILDLLAAPGLQWGFLAGSFLVMAFFGSAVAQGLLYRALMTVAGVLLTGVLVGVFLWRDPENRTLIPAATFGLVAVLSLPLFMVGSGAEAANAPGMDSDRRVGRTVGQALAANPGERAMDGRAMEEVIEGMDALAVSYGLDKRPADWLQGVYLANASQFPEVQAYWERYGAYLEEIRTQDVNWFRQSYETRLREAGVREAAIPAIVERGVARFRASADRRAELYDSMEELVRSALELHTMLLQHEESIAYEPWDEDGISADPVVEAVVQDPEVEDRMWALIARVAVSLEAVTSLGQTSPEHLQAALLDSMRASIR